MKIRYNLYAPGALFLGPIKGYSEPCLLPIGPKEGFETKADALHWFETNRKQLDYNSCIVLERYVYE